MSYKPKYFNIKELVNKELHETLHEDALWKLFDENLLKGLDWLKMMFPKGSIVVNNWSFSGHGLFTQSGIRTKESKYYSKGSAHSVGKAADLKFSHYDEEDVIKVLSEAEVSPYIRRVELGTKGWVHVDTVVKKGYETKIYPFWP